MESVHTPRKTYFTEDRCVLCGIPFVLTSVTSSGRKLTNKQLQNKLKLNDEKLYDILHVLPDFSLLDFEKVMGICLKCHRKVKHVLKTEAENVETRRLLSESRQRVLLDRRVQTEKRMLNSPSGQPLKQPMIAKIQVVKKVCLKSMCTLTEQANVKQPVLRPQLIQPSQLPHSLTEEKPQKKSRKTLPFHDENPSPGYKEAEIRIHSGSGVKSSFITNESHVKLCTVIFHQINVERELLKVLEKTCPEEVASSTSKIVKKELKELCKQSDFALKDKTFKGIMNFQWDRLHQQIIIGAPNTLRVISAMVTDEITENVNCKTLHHILFSIGIVLHGRNQKMTTLQYLNGLVLLHGGCTYRDIERLAKIGISVVPRTVQNKLKTWQDHLDEELVTIRDSWAEGGCKKYQLVGDNWDKNILPSYRTSQQSTQSLHLFNVIGVIDRIVVDIPSKLDIPINIENIETTAYIPSTEDERTLLEELTFLFARSVIENIEQMRNLFGDVYPDHLKHKYSDYIGLKTSQHSLGLFDCDEKKTQDVIKLLKELSQKYVPQKDGEVVEEVFFGGDRLTDERIQIAQKSMGNADSSLERLEGFISKIEDFHRLMNFLEAIHRLTFDTQSSRSRGTVYYYRNLLNARNVKGEVKNSYRAYKHLYYTIFDAVCCVLFLRHFDIKSFDEVIKLPEEFDRWEHQTKINWLNTVCLQIVDSTFFEGGLLEEVREVLGNKENDENYWINSMVDGRFKCHFCDNSYAFIETLKTHEKLKHGHEPVKETKNTQKTKISDELYEYVIALFRLVALHKNLDTAVNMGDGHRVVRSAKYETPIYNKTNKTKYLIGSVHLTGMVSGTLPKQQTERLIANRFINISGGKNHNISLDEYVELLNRDMKNTCSGFQTKESIILHSKEFPYLIAAVKHFDTISEVSGRKGFHNLPSYQQDVKMVAVDLIKIDALTEHKERKLGCQKLVQSKNPYHESFRGLATMIIRHRPVLPFRRLRNKHL